MKGNKISVVIGTYNQYPEPLTTVLKKWRKIKPHQIIVCDDSEKKTPVFKNVFYLKNAKSRKGLEKNLNQALPHITGEYTLFSMGDSVPDRNILREYSKHLDKLTALSGVRVDVKKLTDRKGKRDWRFDHNLIQTMEAHSKPWFCITGNNFLVPTWALKKVGGWSEDYDENEHGFTDYDLAWKLWDKCKVHLKPVIDAKIYHLHHEDASGQTPKRRAQFYEKTVVDDKHTPFKKGEKIVCLDFHDFSPVNHQLKWFRKLKEARPDFRVSMFLVPWDLQFMKQTGTDTAITSKKRFAETLKELDWIEILLHGFNHTWLEFNNLTYEQTMKRIDYAEKMFQNVGLKFKKIFCPPYWEISPAAERAIKDAGYRIVHNNEFTWNIANKFPKNQRAVWGHGHIQNIGNGVEQSFDNLVSIPKDYKFVFLSDYIREVL